MAEKPVTLRELARLSGVSISTVSRALADDPRISHNRRKKIAQLVKRTGYRPQPIRRQRKDAIAMLMATSAPGHTDDDYQARMAAAFALLAEESGFHFHLRLIPRDVEADYLPQIVHEQRVDGVVLSGCPPVSLCQVLHQHQVPAVVMDDYQERTGLCSLRSDYCGAVRSIVDRLAAMGHRSLGFCATQCSWPTVRARCDAFLACQDVTISCQMIDQLSPNMRGGREGLHRILALPNPPTAVLFINDWMAMGAMLEAFRLGIHVPRQLNIVGFDNTKMSEDCEPGLSSVDLGFNDLVKHALKRLNNQITSFHTPDDVTVACKLMWRDSIGIAPSSISEIS